MQKNHNLASYVGFVDLVKAYDTANHHLLFDILEKYGAPPRFIAAIEKCYKDLIVVLKIEKEVVELSQTVGVRQGNNMAPVVFLFLMSAFAETLESEWKNAGIDICTVCSITGSALAAGKGKLWGHYPKEYHSQSLTAVEILQCLYVDDGAFIFSKTECVFFPPPCFFNSRLPRALATHDGTTDSDSTLEYGNESLTDADHESNEQTTRKRCEHEEYLYDALDETQPIATNDGYVTFCQHFK
jgi:hypothetical protein